VALFETGIVQVTSGLGSISALIWQPSNQSATTFGSLGSITAGDVLKDVTIINQGPGTIYAANGSIAASAAPLAMPIPPSGQATFQGYSQTAGTSTAGNIWAIGATGGTTASVIVGLASVASVA
jgi:hypothetical protein